MLRPTAARPVKLFAGVLWREQLPWQQALAALAEVWGPTDAISEPIPFTFTDYYRAEMGEPLRRQLVSFARLVQPGDLPELKLQSIHAEAQSCHEGKRRVNIDVGYLDYGKVVLASTKEGRHRIYLGKGIWAELTLGYEHGRFASFPWTFLDFRQGAYDSFLRRARETYKTQLRLAPAALRPDEFLPPAGDLPEATPCDS
jgi:hypothetical protein